MTMITAAAPFLKKFGPYIIGIIGLLLSYLYWEGRNTTIEDLQIDVIQLKSELIMKEAAYKLNVATLNREIDNANAAIEVANTDFNNLKLESDNAKRELEQKHIERQRALQEKIALLNTIKTPETCEGAIDLILDVAESNPWPTNR